MTSYIRLDVLAAILMYSGATISSQLSVSVFVGVVLYVIASRWDKYALKQGASAEKLRKALLICVVRIWAIGYLAAMALRIGHELFSIGRPGLGMACLFLAWFGVLSGARHTSGYVNQQWQMPR